MCLVFGGGGGRSAIHFDDISPGFGRDPLVVKLQAPVQACEEIYSPSRTRNVV